MEEKQIHLDAFEKYFIHKQAGINTTEAIEKVWLTGKVSKKTLWKWKREFDWDEKEAIRSLEITKKVSEKTNTTIVDNKVTYLGIIHKLLRKLQDGDYNIEIRNVSDVDKLIRTALLLQDEPTGIEKVKVETDIKVIKEELEEYGDVFELVAINDQVRIDDSKTGKDY